MHLGGSNISEIGFWGHGEEKGKKETFICWGKCCSFVSNNVPSALVR
jgi:hypothetical protein